MTRSTAFKAFAVALGLAALAGCGFTPVYGPEAANSGALKIPEIRGRTGHFLRQDLIHAVGQGVPGLPGGVELQVNLAESIARLAFTPDGAAARSDYIGTADWTLQKADGTIMARGQAHQAASFNYADAAYADIAAQAGAQNRLADMLAREIRDELMMQGGKSTSSGVVAPAPAPTPPSIDLRGSTVTVVSPIDPVGAPPFRQ